MIKNTVFFIVYLKIIIIFAQQNNIDTKLLLVNQAKENFRLVVWFVLVIDSD